MDRPWACKACGCPIYSRGDFFQIVHKGAEQNYHRDCVEEEGVCEMCESKGIVVKEFMTEPKDTALICLDCKKYLDDLRSAYAFLMKHGQLNKK